MWSLGRSARRLVLPLAGCAVIAGTIIAQTSSQAATGSTADPTVAAITLPTFELTASQRALAVSVAQTAALESGGSEAQEPVQPNAWPSYVTNVTALGTDHKAAAMYVDQSVPLDDSPVILIRLEGQFSTVIPAPRGGQAIYTGTVEILTVDASTGAIRDFSINDAANIPAPVVERSMTILSR